MHISVRPSEILNLSAKVAIWINIYIYIRRPQRAAGGAR